MFNLGAHTHEILDSCRKDDKMVSTFRENVEKAYRTTAVYLQQKQPLNNELLRALSCIDPIVQGHRAAQPHLLKLPKFVPTILTAEEKDNYYLEIRRFDMCQHCLLVISDVKRGTIQLN